MRKKQLQVKVPPGVESGATLRVSGEGDLGERGGPPGDLYVILQVRPHDIFQRQGDNLLIESPISFVQAALGTVIKVPTLDEEVDLEIKPGTQPGEVYTIRGKGVKHLRGSGSGDIRVGIRVLIPKKLTKEQEGLLQQFAQSSKENVKTSSGHKKRFNLF